MGASTQYVLLRGFTEENPIEKNGPKLEDKEQAPEQREQAINRKENSENIKEEVVKEEKNL